MNQKQRDSGQADARIKTDGQRADTRAALLSAVAECVREGGLEAATSRRITNLAGANLGSITYHFGSKDQLVAQALIGELEARVEPILSVLETAGSPFEMLANAVAAIGSLLDQTGADAALFVAALTSAIHDSSVRDRVDELFGRLRERMGAVLAELRSDEAVPAWVEPQAMADLLISLAQGIVVHSVVAKPGSLPNQQIAQFAQLLVASVPHP